VKLFDRGDQAAKDFDDSTPYIIMFGPDKCGSTDKVHFILKHQNPKSGKWEEKHFKEPPSVPRDDKTHLYGLVINPDNSFAIMLDGKSKASGNLLTSMEPPINPPKEIDDPDDSKPGEWIDEPKMADPESSKPDDWDEDEPRMIDDASATMPSGWVEDGEKKIEDPSAKKPSDWDEEEDGEWEAPTIDNPACKIGCGTWSPPKISNPKYKGKWTAEMIDNPHYKGVWKPKLIDNPDYFADEEPCVLPKINSVGIDIWTMQGGIHYDNFAVSTDVEQAKAFTARTFDVRVAIEDKQNPSAAGGGMFDTIKDTVIKNPIPIAITVVVLLLGTAFLCLRGDSTPPPPPKKKPTNAAKKDEDKTEEKPTEKTDDKKETEEKASKDKKGEAKGKKKDDAKGKKKDDKASEGGVSLDKDE